MEQVWPDGLLSVHLTIERDVIGVFSEPSLVALGQNSCVYKELNQSIVKRCPFFLDLTELRMVFLQLLGFLQILIRKDVWPALLV